jgi:hypothetical protein
MRIVPIRYNGEDIGWAEVDPKGEVERAVITDTVHIGWLRRLEYLEIREGD